MDCLIKKMKKQHFQEFPLNLENRDEDLREELFSCTLLVISRTIFWLWSGSINFFWISLICYISFSFTRFIDQDFHPEQCRGYIATTPANPKWDQLRIDIIRIPLLIKIPRTIIAWCWPYCILLSLVIWYWLVLTEENFAFRKTLDRIPKIERNRSWGGSKFRSLFAVHLICGLVCT